jgi:hypothetical protein
MPGVYAENRHDMVGMCIGHYKKKFTIDSEKIMDGNMVIGTSVYTEFLGLEHTIFVYTDTAHLILQKENSQKVKNIYNKLEKENSSLLN